VLAKSKTFKERRFCAALDAREGKIIANNNHGVNELNLYIIGQPLARKKTVPNGDSIGGGTPIVLPYKKKRPGETDSTPRGAWVKTQASLCEREGKVTA